MNHAPFSFSNHSRLGVFLGDYIRRLLFYGKDCFTAKGLRIKLKKPGCYYLRIRIVVEMIVTLWFWVTVTNMHPYWLRLLSLPYLPLIDVVTIVLWVLICGRKRVAPS